MTTIPTDLPAFCRLFKVHVPVPAHAAYYLATLARSPDHAHVPALAARFAELESALAAEGTTAHRRQQERQARLVAALAATPAYARFLQAKAPGGLPRQDHRRIRRGEALISLDLQQASYRLLRGFDAAGDLGEGWAALCAKHGVEPLFAQSKSFRQAVFGNLEPKRSQQLQHALTTRILAELQAEGLPAADVALIGHDELQFAAGPDPAARLAWLRGRAYPQAIRLTLLRQRGIDEHSAVEEVLEDDLSVRHRRLFAVPGSRFYLAFKRYVLGEEPEERDRLFVSDGHTAMWLD